MHRVTPSSAEDLAFALQEAGSKRRTIEITGNNSKRLMGGPVRPAEVLVCARGLRRVLQYEPNDLTISVEAGMAFADLQKLLAANGQMIALDPPFPAEATVGGIVSANSSGPMRRLFGTARDLIIGMQFATLEGRLVRTGGMVVKMSPDLIWKAHDRKLRDARRDHKHQLPAASFAGANQHVPADFPGARFGNRETRCNCT